MTQPVTLSGPEVAALSAFLVECIVGAGQHSVDLGGEDWHALHNAVLKLKLTERTDELFGRCDVCQTRGTFRVALAGGDVPLVVRRRDATICGPCRLAGRAIGGAG